MTCLYCDKCHWVQDEFWDRQYYNPILAMAEQLQLDDLFNLDPLEITLEEAQDRGIKIIKFLPKEHDKRARVLVSRKDYLAAKLEEYARCIQNMEFRTKSDFEMYKNKNGMKCPKCGKKALELLDDKGGLKYDMY